MTVLVAVRRHGETWIGADSQGTRNGQQILLGVQKWIVWGGWAIGNAGTQRATAVLRSNAKRIFDDVAGIHDISMRVRDVLSEDGFAKHERAGAPQLGEHFIVAYASAVWSMTQDFGYVELPDGEVFAEGSGDFFALGAGHAALAANPKIGAEHLVRLCLETACRFDCGCGGELFIKRLEA